MKKEVSSALPSGERPYNPNRFNGFDGALAFIIVLVAFIVVPSVVSALAGDVLRAIYEFDVYAYMCISIVLSQGIIFLTAFIYSKIRGVNPFDGGGYKISWDGVHVLMAIMLTVGIMMLFYYTHLQFSEFTEVLLPSGNQIEENFSPLSPIFVLVYLFEISVFPAIVEEMMFRGIIMRGLEQFGSLFAVVCSAAMFALMHGNFGQLILQFIGGIAIGGVVMITKNYLLGCIMHFINNSFAFIYTLLITPLVENPVWRNITSVTGAASIALGVIFVLVSSIYFIAMLIEKEKAKALGKTMGNKYEKKRYYAIKEDGEERAVAHTEVPELMLSTENDQRLFLINGRFKRINRRSKDVLSYVFIAIGITLSVVVILLGL